MTNDIEVIRAGFEHMELAAPLFDRYRQFYGQSSDITGARAFLEERLRHEQSVICLALDQASGKGAGFMQLYPTFSSVSMRHTWILNDLFVLPEFRGRGVGRKLLEAARKHAIDTGAKGLSLSTAVDNVTAQKLYESFGFIRDREFYHYDLLI
ncbi:GNAT family N-acetyltransferase [Cohnella pontilimi]|uniref:GNAT family N-acetyltransferase n=1 Tax=Cohnella pontilimi TaxID=2564100 RepID=A0A4U0FI96_9BACL|nr:GNAT family N-acetyltransferase [Cohnella pontilimi]TJY44174.1 GNAT family N-acetyltransferase [Cohnella pontilimi]